MNNSECFLRNITQYFAETDELDCMSRRNHVGLVYQLGIKMQSGDGAVTPNLVEEVLVQFLALFACITACQSMHFLVEHLCQ